MWIVIPVGAIRAIWEAMQAHERIPRAAITYVVVYAALYSGIIAMLIAWGFPKNYQNGGGNNPAVAGTFSGARTFGGAVGGTPVAGSQFIDPIRTSYPAPTLEDPIAEQVLTQACQGAGVPGEGFSQPTCRCVFRLILAKYGRAEGATRLGQLATPEAVRTLEAEVPALKSC